jgi:homoserine dehydrogenase
MPIRSNQQTQAAERLCVLKFGSSVLVSEEHYLTIVQEVYRHVREGEKVVAVVSALAGETDALLQQATRVGGEGAPASLVARVVRIGELRSAALLALALTSAGLRATAIDPQEIGLLADGSPLDSNLVSLDVEAVWSCVSCNDVVVLPGFIASHSDHGVVTLGRGGTDLSAVFLANRLDAARLRLIKDVDGVYEKDPATSPNVLRYSSLDYAQAEQASDGLIQAKAIRAADEWNVVIEVAALGSADATTIARVAAAKANVARAERLKVALLGCGSVGAGVLRLLQARSDLFELGPVLVRDPCRHSEPAQFTTSLDEALSGDPDMVVELIGRVGLARDAIHHGLLQGAQVVTANKAAVARYWDLLQSDAARHGGELRYSGAVGGGAPVIEAVRRQNGKVSSIEGVMNGTCNYLLARLAEGWSLDRALAKARELGLAEAEPSGDVDADDAADKLSILIREAFGVALLPKWIEKHSLRHLMPGAAARALARGESLKQVGSCRVRPDESVEAKVSIVSLPCSHPLARTTNEENRFLVADLDGHVHDIFGKGAGRWPTAAAVFADIMDGQRTLIGRPAHDERDSAKLRA